MGVLDFLFEGKPPESVTTYGQTVENMPKWYSDYTEGLVAKANSIAAEPYQTYNGPRVAGFTPQQQQSFQDVQDNQGAYKPYTNAATSYFNSAGQVNPLSYASPYLNSAATETEGALSAAKPYMDAASKNFPGSVQDYMDPYVGNVIDRGTQLAMRNYNENIQPGLNSQFVRAGQYGSSAHEHEANQAARDLTEGVQSNAMSQLSQGYQTAGQLFDADAARQGNLAQLAQTGALQQGAQMGQIGATQGQLANLYAQNQLSTGQNMGSLGDLIQSMGLKDSAALEGVGAEQQALGQRSLDTAYQDFTNQKNFPKSQVDWLSTVIRGMQVPTSTTTSNTAPATSSQPSPLAQLATLGSALKGWGALSNSGGTG